MLGMSHVSRASLGHIEQLIKLVGLEIFFFPSSLCLPTVRTRRRIAGLLIALETVVYNRVVLSEGGPSRLCLRPPSRLHMCSGAHSELHPTSWARGKSASGPVVRDACRKP